MKADNVQISGFCNVQGKREDSLLYPETRFISVSTDLASCWWSTSEVGGASYGALLQDIGCTLFDQDLEEVVRVPMPGCLDVGGKVDVLGSFAGSSLFHRQTDNVHMSYAFARSIGGDRASKATVDTAYC